MCGKIGVAVSGGIDSMCLLHYCMENNFGAQIVAINIDHGIRGEESRRDSAFVLDYCAKNKIECLHLSVDVPQYAKKNKIGVEESARLLRYVFFRELIAQKKIDKIFTAHHASDRAETLLLSLTRGSGTGGASAKMQGFLGIYRPWLNVSKQEICLYAEQHRVPYVVDTSNFDDTYSRNLIRNKVLPLLNSINPQTEQHLANFCQKMQDTDDYLTALAKKYVKIEKNCSKISIKIDDILMFNASKLCNVEVDIKKTEQLCKLKSAENGKVIQLSGCFAAKEYEYITFYKTLPEYQIVWKKCQKIAAHPSLSVFKRFRTLYIDKTKIPASAQIRKLREGDIFCKFDGTKKAANDFLQERKIPLRLRKNLPVLASGNEILLIFGVEISQTLAVTDIKNCHKVYLRQH